MCAARIGAVSSSQSGCVINADRRLPPALLPLPSSPPSRPLLPRSSAGFNKTQDLSFLSFKSKRCYDWRNEGQMGYFQRFFQAIRSRDSWFLGKRTLSSKTMAANKSVIGSLSGSWGGLTRVGDSPSPILLLRKLIGGAGDLSRSAGGGIGWPRPKHGGELCF